MPLYTFRSVPLPYEVVEPFFGPMLVLVSLHYDITFGLLMASTEWSL